MAAGTYGARRCARPAADAAIRLMARRGPSGAALRRPSAGGARRRLDRAARRSRSRRRPGSASGPAIAPSPSSRTTGDRDVGRIEAAGARGDEHVAAAERIERRPRAARMSIVPSPRPIAMRRRAVAQQPDRHVAGAVGDQQHPRGPAPGLEHPADQPVRRRAPAGRPRRRRCCRPTGSRSGAALSKRRADDPRRRRPRRRLRSRSCSSGLAAAGSRARSPAPGSACAASVGELRA